MFYIVKWQRFRLFAIFGLILTFLISCTTLSPNLNTQEIKFWTIQLQPQFTNYFNQLIADFEADNPGLSVRWVDVPWSEMESKIESAILTETLPDVVNLNSSFAHLLTEPNTWLNLDTILSDSVKNEYLSNLWQASQINDKSFGIPWYATTNITIYNSQLFQQAGLEQPPKNYSELAEVAKQIKEKTDKYAFFISFLPEEFSEVLESFGKMGVTLIDVDGKAAFNTPTGQTVFKYWVDLYQDGLLPKEVLTKGIQAGIDLYQAGEIAMLFSGSEAIEAISENTPDIGQASEPVSQITGETGKKSMMLMNLAISSNTKLPDQALKFALFITNNQNQTAFTQETNVLPSITQTLENNYFQNLPSNASTQDKARIISANQMLKAEVLLPQVKNLNELKQIISQNLQAAMLAEKTVDQAIADAASEWDNL
ncbi:MAG: sugar ABC transporter substrate-binding protein [Okeania sp. SIO2G4]|uniref:ABC transporter substrate-binding protein n=1 Tax=unclassified Okeania TaxID=2634635 RepID=UPI0013B9134E|nr:MULTISPECIES: sugar ABC transporter substrate-binding protein [unclassified Okeania]NEP06386.1 sugar ABC transporter substrate-binding protein [Okeania sp. SIO4D6]NEP43348.1 sugar ABC transporter substrate-binding protein [Okeania sp. SIO2H7]NEP72163.1 sugar ABC transporter substrate-binding protein [Okeania sp. SIO2G5]NEP91816.1 sugar ABC transporter substrate-binding protein [Okeania sp. SIO2F5]NEQ90776.1 sugar ABC transporter substrate-binding protein [Okeania sp. SIO2G4]